MYSGYFNLFPPHNLLMCKGDKPSKKHPKYNYVCLDCIDETGMPRTFVSKSKLARHRATRHSREKWYRCSEEGCLYRTNRHDSLRLHERNMTHSYREDLPKPKTPEIIIKERRYRCEFLSCKFMNDSKSKMDEHKYT